MTHPNVAWNVADRVRAADPRVDVVARALLAQRLGLAGDDLELLADATVADLLALPTSVVLPLAAARLLAHLDALAAREHPVDVEHYPDRSVARVPVGDDDARELVLADGVVRLDRDLPRCDLAPADAEALAYALLRLAALAREDEA